MKKHFVALAVGGLCVCSAFAAPKNSNKDSLPPSKAKAASVVDSWQPTAFIANKDKLPPAFWGLDPKKFYEMFSGKVAVVVKGDFETSAEFKLRVSDADSILAPINTSDLYAFKITDVDFKYDADTQVYAVASRDRDMCRNLITEDSSGWKSCKIAPVSREMSSYVGSNAYGASQDVTKTRGVDLALAIPHASRAFESVFSKRGSSDQNSAYQDSVSVPIEKAREFSGQSLGVLLVGRVTRAKLMTGRGEHTSPTRSWSYDESITEYAIPFEIKNIIYYSIATGEIFGHKEF